MRKRERGPTSRVQRARSSERPCPTLGPVPVQRRYYHLGRLHRGHSDGFTMFTRALWNPFEQQRHPSFLKGTRDIFIFVCYRYAFIEFLFALDFICKNISCLLAMWLAVCDGASTGHENGWEIHFCANCRDSQLGLMAVEALTEPFTNRVIRVGTAKTLRSSGTINCIYKRHRGGRVRSWHSTTCCDVFFAPFTRWPGLFIAINPTVDVYRGRRRPVVFAAVVHNTDTLDSYNCTARCMPTGKRVCARFASRLLLVRPQGF